MCHCGYESKKREWIRSRKWLLRKYRLFFYEIGNQRIYLHLPFPPFLPPPLPLLSIYLSIYLPIYLSVYLSIFLPARSIDRSISLQYPQYLIESKLLLQTKQDRAIVRVADEVCRRSGRESLSLTPEALIPTRKQRMLFRALADVPTLTIQLRFLVLRNFNRRLLKSIALIDLSCMDGASVLASRLRSLRGLIMSDVKEAIWTRVLMHSHTGDADSMQKKKTPLVRINRDRAWRLRRSEWVDVKGTETVFSQLFQQLHRPRTSAVVAATEAAIRQLNAEEAQEHRGGRGNNRDTTAASTAAASCMYLSIYIDLYRSISIHRSHRIHLIPSIESNLSISTNRSQ